VDCISVYSIVNVTQTVSRVMSNGVQNKTKSGLIHVNILKARFGSLLNLNFFSMFFSIRWVFYS
jgi:hypothetical protein